MNISSVSIKIENKCFIMRYEPRQTFLTIFIDMLYIETKGKSNRGEMCDTIRIQVVVHT